jgi:hypothetical protein
MERVEQCGNRENPRDTKLNINNERQNCEIGTVCVCVGGTSGRGRVNEGDQDEGI